MEQYFGVVVMFLLALVFVALSVVASRLLAPYRPTKAKRVPYECGIVPSRGVAERFPVAFYLVAMIFIVFDVEIVFLYPWAVAYGQLGTFGLVEMVVFVATLVGSFAYLAASGALEWGPLSMVARRISTIVPGRTAASTIRRVPPSREAA
jgi:NADH-quinone oxidoreductase subunit A